MLWGGAFNEGADELLRRLNDSFPFDRRMWREDIFGSIAYANAIADARVITREEADTLIAGLKKVHAEFESETFKVKPGDEDIHTAVERRLTEIIGPVGGKLHTGRSRNDQVATDLRLWTLGANFDIRRDVEDLCSALISQSEKHIETLMPGYTHTQPAQPITAAHWLMSYFWMLTRDIGRLKDAEGRTEISPLGAGALAGHPFGVDLERLAGSLSMYDYSRNSLDAVSDRDFVAEMLFVLALMGTHLSRLAEDIIWFSNPAFGFITLDDRYSTGSSIMPQKRNADPMELTRGKAGRLIGHLTGLLTTLKGLPTGYNKDLQEDKEPLFDAVDTMMHILPIITEVVATLKLNPEKMRAAVDPAMLATDLAEYLVRKELPFREAHRIVGRAVRLAAEREIGLTALSVADLQTLSPLFDDDTLKVFDFAASVASRASPNGTAPDAVRGQIAAAREWLEGTEKT